jgi:hypothetical protein
MENFDYSVVPRGFGHCMASCPQAATCLRHIAYEHLPADKAFVRMLVPHMAEQTQGKCKYYCSNAKVRYAKGLARIIDELSVKQAAAFRERMIGKMGRKHYYASRKGDRLLPPAKQKQVRSVLRSLRAPDENCFDGYTDCFVWE